MRAIPYPMVLVFENNNKIQIFTAHQRINLADSSKNTIEEFIQLNGLILIIWIIRTKSFLKALILRI
jgi:phosphopantetheine adenylyltransferase